MKQTSVQKGTIHVRVADSSDHFSGYVVQVTTNGSLGIWGTERELSRLIKRMFPSWRIFMSWLSRESDDWAIRVHSEEQ